MYLFFYHLSSKVTTGFPWICGFTVKEYPSTKSMSRVNNYLAEDML